MASGTGWPSPSSTRPSMLTRSPETLESTRSCLIDRHMPMEKKGPIVCDVVAELTLALHGRGFAPAHYNVEPIAECLRRNCGLPVENRNQPIARAFIRRAIENRIERKERVTGEIHLSH